MLDLVKILKDCPKGTKLYSAIHGEVALDQVNNIDEDYPIVINCIHGLIGYTYDGRFDIDCNGECVLFPSKDQRDWSKFVVPQSKKERFNPETLKPFDKVIVRLNEQCIWCCDLFSFVEKYSNLVKGCGAYYKQCVPCNEETKHLIGTANEAPVHYRYWED